VYHSLLLKYVPKRQEFDGDQMDARTTLAVIDHNLSQNRGQKIDAQGQGVYKTAYSKGTRKWVAKPVYNKKFRQSTYTLHVYFGEKNPILLPKIFSRISANNTTCLNTIH
jgi:hypothetical protein